MNCNYCKIALNRITYHDYMHICVIINFMSILVIYILAMGNVEQERMSAVERFHADGR